MEKIANLLLPKGEPSLLFPQDGEKLGGGMEVLVGTGLVSLQPPSAAAQKSPSG